MEVTESVGLEMVPAVTLLAGNHPPARNPKVPTERRVMRMIPDAAVEGERTV